MYTACLKGTINIIKIFLPLFLQEIETLIEPQIFPITPFRVHKKMFLATFTNPSSGKEDPPPPRLSL